MLLGNILKEAPHIYQLIKNELIGNGGVPDAAGDAKSGYVRAAEVMYNAPKGSYWYRPMRPNDTFVGGTQYTYYATWNTATVEGIVGTTSTTQNTVPTREAIVCFGWYCELDLDQGGYLLIKKHGVTKSEIPARFVWRQKEPDHLYIDMDTVIHGVENEKFDFHTYNAYGFNITGIIYPVLFRIAPRAALNLEKVPK